MAEDTLTRTVLQSSGGVVPARTLCIRNLSMRVLEVAIFAHHIAKEHDTLASRVPPCADDLVWESETQRRFEVPLSAHVMSCAVQISASHLIMSTLYHIIYPHPTINSCRDSSLGSSSYRCLASMLTQMYFCKHQSTLLKFRYKTCSATKNRM